MGGPNGLLRVEVSLDRMTFNMAEFIEVELEKRKKEFQAIAANVISQFDVEKEVRAQFERSCRDRIHKILEIECFGKARELLDGFEINISITPKKIRRKAKFCLSCGVRKDLHGKEGVEIGRDGNHCLEFDDGEKTSQAPA